MEFGAITVERAAVQAVAEAFDGRPRHQPQGLAESSSAAVATCGRASCPSLPARAGPAWPRAAGRRSLRPRCRRPPPHEHAMTQHRRPRPYVERHRRRPPAGRRGLPSQAGFVLGARPAPHRTHFCTKSGASSLRSRPRRTHQSTGVIDDVSAATTSRTSNCARSMVSPSATGDAALIRGGGLREDGALVLGRRVPNHHIQALTDQLRFGQSVPSCSISGSGWPPARRAAGRGRSACPQSSPGTPAIASSSADWVLGGEPLNPRRRGRCREDRPRQEPDDARTAGRSSSITSVPRMSDGIRSGVNWMRLNFRLIVSASVLMISVFARPGTPRRRQWPPARRRSGFLAARRRPARTITLRSSRPQPLPATGRRRSGSWRRRSGHVGMRHGRFKGEGRAAEGKAEARPSRTRSGPGRQRPPVSHERIDSLRACGRG